MNARGCCPEPGIWCGLCRMVSIFFFVVKLMRLKKKLAGIAEPSPMLAWTPCVRLVSGLVFVGHSAAPSAAPDTLLLRMQRVPMLPTGDVSFVCNEAFENCKAVSSGLLESLDSGPFAMCPWRETQFMQLIDASKEQSYQQAMALLFTCWVLLAVLFLLA